MPKCSDVMTKNPQVCAADDTVIKAAQLMKAKDVGPIPIVESTRSNKLVGIVTDRDLALKVVAEGRDSKHTKVEEVMSHDLVTCREGDDLDQALHLMAAHQIRRIPVVNAENQIVGIISQADVANRQADTQKTAEVVEEISQPEKK